MKNFLFLLPVFLILGCRPESLHLARNRSETGSGDRSRHTVDPEIPPASYPDTLVYVSAVEFPEGYDWQRDSAYGKVPCQLSLFLGGERILSIPAGPGSGISPDADRMRIREGHLYTDNLDGTETVIRRDGEELFRYPGRESLRGFLLVGGKVHTLGQNLDGDGFAYRIDGRPILQKDEGTLVGTEDHPAFEGGALYVSSGKVCFSYTRETTLSREIILVEDGRATRSEPCPEALWVHDQRLLDGVLYRVEKRSAAEKDPTLVMDGQSLHPDFWYRGDSRKCLIFPSEDGAVVLGFSRPKGLDVPYIWIRGSGIPVARRTDVTMLLYEKGTVAYMAPGVAVVGEKQISFPGKLRLYSRKCASLLDGKLYLALTGDPNRLISDGKECDIPIHGFLTGVRVEVPEKSVSLSP